MARVPASADANGADPPPAPDHIEGIAHPRQTHVLWGQEQAEQALLQGINSGKLHHAWLLAGVKGIGKATLAYRVARFLLSRREGQAPFASLDVEPENPTARLIAADSHPGLLALKRPWDEKKKRFLSVLSVDEVRRVHGFFGLAAGAGSWRVMIIDPVDDMNVQAANALLKSLEEPPERTVIFLIAHQLGHVLPTLRSRCRLLKLRPLTPEVIRRIIEAQSPEDLGSADLDTAIALSGGSARAALQFCRAGGARLYGQILSALSADGAGRVRAAGALAGQFAKAGNENAFDLSFDLLVACLEKCVAVGAGAASPADLLDEERTAVQRLLQTYSLEHLTRVWERVRLIKANCDALYLDRRQAVLEAFRSLDPPLRPVTA